MKRRNESGFALLLVFVLAAGIAIGLMMQLRRVAFETARDREEMLIERGEQYKRAIALYYRKTNRLPSKLEDLESTNNVRFLRRRYIDPMTGKDEWRIIHAGPGGVLIDSMIKKTPTTTGPDGKPLQNGQTGQSGQNFGMNPGNTVGSSGGAFGTSSTSGTNGTGDGTEPVEVNAAVLRRPSDRGTGGIPTNTGPTSNDPNQTNDTSQTAYQTQQQPIYPGQPGYPQPGTAGYTGQPIYPGQAGYPASGTQQQSASQTGQPIYPGQPGYPQPGTAGYTGQPIYPGQAGYPTTGTSNQQQVYNPMQNMPGVINPQQTGTMNQPGMPQLPGQPAYNPNNPNVATSPPGSAVGMINDLLRSPRTPPSGAGSAFNNSGMQGGMAGVASNFKGPSIKIYKERKKYQEWEFVYDIKEDPYLKQKNTGSGAGLGNVNPGNTGITNQTGFRQ